MTRKLQERRIFPAVDIERSSTRREDLLRKRRDEFVMMPHAIRRVVVARAARKAASLAMIVAGIGMVGLLAYIACRRGRIGGERFCFLTRLVHLYKLA